MSEQVVVQGGIRPWMFFVGLVVVSLVILFSTGTLQKMRPLSSAEQARLGYVKSMEAANDPSLAAFGANDRERERWANERRRIENRERR